MLSPFLLIGVCLRKLLVNGDFIKPFQKVKTIKIRFYLRFALAIRFCHPELDEGRVSFFSQFCQ